MSALPPPLAAWRGLLDLLPEPLALAMSRMAGPLLAAIGPLHGEPGAGGDRFDGYDGLSVRGPYERLLATEWLLALEAPDEFLRRAAMNEHAFLRPAFREPRVSPLSTALFDAGPQQLGAPRLAHVAALLVLARRAADAGGRFEWGVLQREPVPIREVTAVTLSALLHARTFAPPTEDAARRWRAAWGGEAGETWIVGGDAALALPAMRDARGLRVEEADEEALTARLQLPGRLPRDVALPLPPAEDRVRLLRDPLRAPRIRPHKLSPSDHRPTSALVFVHGGRHICARGEGNEILTYAVPGSPGEARLPLAWIPPHRPLAVGGARRSTVAICTDGEALFVYAIRREAPIPAHACALPGDVALPPTDAFLPCSPVLGDDERPFVLTLLGDVLVRVAPAQPPSARVSVVARGVRAIAYLGRDTVFLQQRASGLHALLRLQSAGPPVTVRTVECGGRAEFGFGGSLHQDPFGLVALQEGRRWDVLFRDPDGRDVACASVEPPHQARVIAPFAVRGPTPGLLALLETHNVLLFCGVGASHVVLLYPPPLRTVTPCASRPLIAWVELDGALAIHQVDPWKALARWR